MESAQISFKHDDLQDVADALKDKADLIRHGHYGPEDNPGDDASWIGDLMTAASLLETGNLRSLTHQHIEEIECCTGEIDGLEDAANGHVFTIDGTPKEAGE